MLRLVSLVLIAALVSGCATPPPKPAYLKQKDENKALILAAKQVEIVYHPDEYAVVDLGGTKSQGLLGVLGPIGLLAGFTALTAHALSTESRAKSRSEEFTKLMSDHFQEQSVNKAFAQLIASQLEASGHVTKLTQIPLSKDAVTSFQGTDGYSQLWLRTSLGYGATSLTDSFKPTIVIDYTLKDPGGKTLMSRKYSEYFADSDQTFLTYSSLLDGYEKAHEELQMRMAGMSKPIYAEIFDFSDNEKIATK